LLIGRSGFVSGVLAHPVLEQGHILWTVMREQRSL
jgi:hypothetical protein